MDLSWEEPLELSAEYDHGRAEAVERVRSVTVLQEISGELIGVEGAAGSQVACEEPLSGLDCELCSLVGPWVVCLGDPVCDSPAA